MECHTFFPLARADCPSCRTKIYNAAVTIMGETLWVTKKKGKKAEVKATMTVYSSHRSVLTEVIMATGALELGQHKKT